MKIVEIENGSIGSKLGLKAGDVLQTINHRPIRDLIDYKYYTSDESLMFQIQRGEKMLEIRIEKHPDEDLGLRLENIPFNSCKNSCIFCFIDQLPAGMRPPLYFKDEDYRLSFLQGTYITLTGISKEDLDRIREQQLSPLYISVHSTDPQLRRRMIRSRDAGELMARIEYLAQGKIELHTQVVLCPGINDGPHLERTVRDLSRFYPQVRSVAIVPVGLTRHRQGLYPLRGIDPPYARSIIEDLQPWQEDFRRMFGETFLHLADEFYLLAGIDLPETPWYHDSPQIENGVGMVRRFLDTCSDRRGELPRKVDVPTKVTVVTGRLGCRLLDDEVLPAMPRVENLHVRTAAVENRFFGESVTVSGLLTGEDIVRTLKDVRENGVVMLPPNCVNEDGLLLDDMTVDELERRLRRRVVVGSYDFIGSLLTLIGSVRV